MHITHGGGNPMMDPFLVMPPQTAEMFTSGVVSPQDEGFNTLMDNPPSLADISSHFQLLRESYETAIAKAKVGEMTRVPGNVTHLVKDPGDMPSGHGEAKRQKYD
jgi:hypothetical protein